MATGSRRRFLTLSLALAVLATICNASLAAAASGDMDPSFGVNGGLTTRFDDGDAQARAIAAQPDGRILAAGHAGLRFSLARYLPNGTLDPRFGSGGKVITDFTPSPASSPSTSSSECSEASCFGNSAEAFALVLQADGRVVAAGGVVSNGFGAFALARYRPSGQLDPTFGEGGKVTTRHESVDARAFALVIQPDGKLVAGGYALRGSFDFAIARYLPDGTLDRGFGQGGFVMTDFFNGMDQVRSLVVEPDGKLVAAGFALRGGKFQFAMARYLPDGTLDAGFGDGGKMTTPFPDGDAQGFALVLQPDGRLVIAGGAVIAAKQVAVPRPPPPGDRSDDSKGAFALARYLADGTPDTTFGVDGKLTLRFDEGAAAGASALILEPYGKLVAAGFRHDGKRFEFALARFLPTGTLDPSFGSNGKLTTGFEGADAQALALAVQPDGKLVAAGLVLNGERSEFALTRHKNEFL